MRVAPSPWFPWSPSSAAPRRGRMMRAPLRPLLPSEAGRETARERGGGGSPPMNAPLHASALPTLVLTCGSVDDGKSTLIGRLLYEQKLIFDDQLSALERELEEIRHHRRRHRLRAARRRARSRARAGHHHRRRLSLFRDRRRSFIVADTPGHEQYTRNMATGASNADLAILLVDARKGLLTQTRRHSIIVSLLGIRHVVLAVNKIDLVDYDERIFRDIVDAFRKFAEPLGFRSLFAIPMSARFGDNVSSVSPSARPGIRAAISCSISKPSRSRRTARRAVPPAGAMGQPAASRFPRLRRHDRERARCARRRRSSSPVPGEQTTVKSHPRRRRGARKRRSGRRGDADARRRGRHRARRRAGAPDSRPEVADQFTAHLIWMSADADAAGPLLSHEDRRADGAGAGHRAEAPHRRQQLRQARRQELGAQRDRPLQSRDDRAGRVRPLRATIATTGAFILIDRRTNETAAAGMIAHGLRRATNVHRHGLDGRRAKRMRRRSIRSRRSSGSPACRAPASRPSPISSRRSCMRAASTPPCSTATTCAMASTRISASPPPTASRTSAASARSRS